MSLLSNLNVDGGGGAGGAGGGRGGRVGRPTTAKPVVDLGESSATNIIPGTCVYAKYRDGSERRAIVIERRAVMTDRGESTRNYYLHYTDFNRRMDTWVDAASVRYDAEGDEAAKREAKAKAEKAKAGLAAGAAGTAVAAADHDGGKAGKHGGKTGIGGKSAAGGAAGAARHVAFDLGPGGGGGSSSSSSAKHGHGAAGASADGSEVVDTDGTRLRFHRRAAGVGAGSSGSGAAGGDVVVEFVEPEHEHAGMGEEEIREHEEVTKVKNVNTLEMGRYRMQAWYFTPLPPEFWVETGFIDTLYTCEFCLKLFRRRADMLHHCTDKCGQKHPPGDEIYRSSDGKISMWEVCGTKEQQYCQNLCYLAKMFLDHKTLWFDCSVFFFYVQTEADEWGYHVTGYFSKEKYSEAGLNLACILTFPPHQRKGYGRFLIQFSYELSKIERKAGSPEKPLSDLGLLSYHSYWSWVLLGQLRALIGGGKSGGGGASSSSASPAAGMLVAGASSSAAASANAPALDVSIMDLVERTSIITEDVVSTLHQLGILRTCNGSYVITAQPDAIEKEFTRLDSKPGALVEPSRIHWAPHRALPAHIKRDKWSIAAMKASPGE